MSDDTAVPDETFDLSELQEIANFRIMRKWIMVGEKEEAIRLDQMCLYFEIEDKKYGITFRSRMMADQFIFLLIQARDSVWPGPVGMRGKRMEA
jgi:hypothetical protein